MRVLACALVVFVFALSGCRMTETTAATSGPINATCVMKHNKAANAACCVDYKGQKIAFCCKMCKAKFESLSDAEKEARINAVQKK